MADGQKNNQNVLALVAAAVLVASIVWIAGSGSRGSRVVGDGYYLDLTTGKLFAASMDEIAPIDAPDGGAGQGVHAIVYGCGDCSESDRQIAYLISYSDAAHSAIAEIAPEMRPQLAPEILDRARRIAALPEQPGEKPIWFEPMSAKGEMIAKGVDRLCTAGEPVQCSP